MRMKDCFDQGLLRKGELKGEVVAKEAEVARKHISNAERCLKEGMHDLAMVAIYTSMFHSARAVLYKDGIRERSHVCVIIYLQEKYPELVRFTRLMDIYRRNRHTVLYGVDCDVAKNDVVQGITDARDFLTAVSKVCSL